MYHIQYIAQVCYESQLDFEDIDQLTAKVKSATVKAKSDKPKLLLLVARFSLLSQYGKAGQMLPYISLC